MSPDRKRLKAITNDMEIPDGMAVIVRTAGSERTKPEIKRDYEYLLRLWDSVRELTLKSTAPALVYEEANLIKRSIRDLYSRDIDEILVDGEEGYRLAKDFMRMLTPSHARRVQLFKDPVMPLFQRYQVEAQLDAMHSPIVQLKSGGYLVINQTEALVAIDVNSGRSTKERHIEETALKTNLRGRRRGGPPVAPARSGRPDRHRLHRHGRGAQQPHGGTPPQGSDALRPRPHPVGPDQPLRPVGAVAPAPASQPDGNQLPALPPLRRHRHGPFGGIGVDACAAGHRGRRHPPPLQRNHRHRPQFDRALYPQSEARAIWPISKPRYGFLVFLTGDDSLVPPALPHGEGAVRNAHRDSARASRSMPIRPIEDEDEDIADEEDEPAEIVAEAAVAAAPYRHR